MIGGNCGSLLLLLTGALINKSCERGDFTHASGTTKVKWRKKLDLPFELNWNDDISNLHMGGWSGLISPVGALLCTESAKMIVFGSSIFQIPKYVCMTFFLFGQIKDVKWLSLCSPVPRLTLTLGSTKRLATIWSTLSVFLTFYYIVSRFLISNTWKLFQNSF